MAENIVNLDIQKDPTKDPKKKSIEYDENEIPEYKTEIELTDEEKTRIVKEIEAELAAIDKEYDAAGLLNKWDALDKQYEGEMREIEFQSTRPHGARHPSSKQFKDKGLHPLFSEPPKILSPLEFT